MATAAKRKRRIKNDAVQYHQSDAATKHKKGTFLPKLLFRTAVILALIGCTATIVSLQSSIAERETELSILKQQTEAYQAENEDLERILNSDDIDAYMERLAREEYGYAYADEQRFYDTSRN